MSVEPRTSGRLAGRHVNVPANEIKRTRPELTKLRADREAKQQEEKAAVAKAEKEASNRSARRVADEEDREALHWGKIKSIRPDIADSAGSPAISAAISSTYAHDASAPHRGRPRGHGIPASRGGGGVAISGRGVPIPIRGGVPIPIRGGARGDSRGSTPVSVRGRGAAGRGAIVAGQGAGRGRGTSAPRRHSTPPDDDLVPSFDRFPNGQQPDTENRPASRMDTSADGNSRPISRMDIVESISPNYEHPPVDPIVNSSAAALSSPSHSQQASPESAVDRDYNDEHWLDPLTQQDAAFYDSEGPPPGSEIGDSSEGVSSEGGGFTSGMDDDPTWNAGEEGVDNEDDDGKARYQRLESGEYGIDSGVYDDDMESSGSEFRLASDEEFDEEDEYGVFNVDSEDVGSATAALERSIAEMQAKVAALRGEKTPSDTVPASKSRPKAAAKLKDKMSIRTAVAEQRASKKDGAVNVRGGGKKRGRNTEDDEPEPETSMSTKRSRTPHGGGLASDWRDRLTGDSKVRPEPKASARKDGKGKAKGTKGVKHNVSNLDVTFVAADVQQIDEGDRKKAVKYKASDLPFRRFKDDYPLWQQKLVTSLIDWSGSDALSQPFGTTNHDDFKATTKRLWELVFGHLPVRHDDGDLRSTHPAVYSVAATALRTHRSDLGKYAGDVVRRKIETDEFPEADDRRAYALDQLDDERFIYYDPDTKVKGEAYPFQNPMIVETFAYHVGVVDTAPHTHGIAVAALAISAAAVNRALSFFTETGVYSGPVRGEKKPGSRNNENSFKDDPWGHLAAAYFTDISNVVDEQAWADIMAQARQWIPKNLKQASKPVVSAGPALGGQRRAVRK